MALVLADRVQETTTSTGTGSVTLAGAVTGYQTFAVIGNGNTTFYTIADQGGANWEVGVGTYSTTGPSLSRDTVLASSNSGSLVNFTSGTKTVFVTYPSEKSVNLNAAGNVSALGTISSGTWQGSTVGVAYGGTGVTASSGANSVVLRDAYGNVNFNSYTVGLTVVAATGGTTTLTEGSTWYQVFTGSSAQTVVLPQANLLPVGFAYFIATNNTGGLTIKNNAGTTIDTTVPGNIGYYFLVDNSSSAGSWANYNLLPPTYDFSSASADFGGAAITNAVWQGNTIATNYGGTGLTSFSSGGALYATSSSALTSGTLPVTAGGTGQTSFPSGYIPYGNSTAALQSSGLLHFNGSFLEVGGGSPLGGATNPIAAFAQSANNYVQTYTYNADSGTSGSADYVAYTDNSTDAHGWADMGFTSSTYNDPVYTITGANEAYVLGSAPALSGATGNLVYATDNTGTGNAHQWYANGFTQAKSAYLMQLDTSRLEVKVPLYVTGSTGTSGQVLTSAGSGAAPTWVTPTTGGGTVTTTDFTATAGQTVFTVSYTVGATEVYKNGVKLGIADYTATNGSTITLASGAAAGDLVEVVTFSSLNLYSTITYEDFSGTGSQTVFTMSAVPANSASLLVAISGVVQDPGTYTVSSTTLTFGTAPPAGTNNISVRYLGIASVGTVSSFSAGTTGFTPSSSTTGSVTLGGILNVANGGTGQSSLTANNVILGNGTSAVQTVAPGTSGNLLTSNGTTWVSTAAPSGGQYFGTASPKAIAYNASTINENITVSYPSMSVGPITIGSGYTVTVNSGVRWVVI